MEFDSNYQWRVLSSQRLQQEVSIVNSIQELRYKRLCIRAVRWKLYSNMEKPRQVSYLLIGRGLHDSL